MVSPSPLAEPSRGGLWMLQDKGVASPTCPTQSHWGLWQPSHTWTEPLEVRHRLQRGLFRVYPTPLMENFPLLPAIPLFFMFFLSSLFSRPVQGSCSALLIRGWL